ncbi:hypothetical protein, partial [Mycobacterium helveticum]|uniref:hypothetical protein n=1 Tax=Mycobacterium helveticum TaxID=2592811 RepID=UPI001AEFA17B
GLWGRILSPSTSAATPETNIASTAPGPTANPPQQGPPLSPGGDDHGGGAWVRRHLDRYGIPLPWP